jgi:hypothetical protein
MFNMVPPAGFSLGLKQQQSAVASMRAQSVVLFKCFLQWLVQRSACWCGTLAVWAHWL